MNWPDQSASVQNVAKSAITWFKKTRVPDMIYNKAAGQFETQAGASLWYRFYDLKGDKGFFCDRDGVKTYDIATVSKERRTGYSWGGNTASVLLSLESEYLNALGGTSISSTNYNPENTAKQVIRMQSDRIDVSIGANGTYHVLLTDARGSVLFSNQLTSASGHLEMSIPEGRFAQGLCILHVKNTDGSCMSTYTVVRK
jgi:hypothetical protein